MEKKKHIKVNSFIFIILNVLIRNICSLDKNEEHLRKQGFSKKTFPTYVDKKYLYSLSCEDVEITMLDVLKILFINIKKKSSYKVFLTVI